MKAKLQTPTDYMHEVVLRLRSMEVVLAASPMERGTHILCRSLLCACEALLEALSRLDTDFVGSKAPNAK